MEYSDAKAGQPCLWWKCPFSRGHAAIRSYPSGEPLIDIPREVNDVSVIMVKPRSMLELMGALFFADAAMARSSRPIDLILPFVPGSRQDRLNDRGDYLFTAKSVAKEINARKFRKVTILDPHSDVMPALIERCHVVSAVDCVGYAVINFADYAGVISPDAGAEKRAFAVSKHFTVPIKHGWKTRNVSTGELAGFGIETPIAAGRYLVVDDICDGGGTFIGLAEKLAISHPHVSVDLYTTHGIYSNAQNAFRMKELFGRLMCTDSIDGNKYGADVIPICSTLFEDA